VPIGTAVAAGLGAACKDSTPGQVAAVRWLAVYPSLGVVVADAIVVTLGTEKG
jgi:hypothetical protein